MKVESLIHPRRKATRTVDVLGTPYVFAQQDDGRFVAEVGNTEHAEILLGNRHFAPVGGKPRLVPAAPVKDDMPPPPPSTVDAKVSDEAAKLIVGSVSEIGKAVGQVTSLAVVIAAIELEKSAEKPRSSAIALLESALESARQAGVTE